MVNNDLIVVFAKLDIMVERRSGALFIRNKRGGVTVVIGWAELVANNDVI